MAMDNMSFRKIHQIEDYVTFFCVCIVLVLCAYGWGHNVWLLVNKPVMPVWEGVLRVVGIPLWPLGIALGWT